MRGRASQLDGDLVTQGWTVARVPERTMLKEQTVGRSQARASQAPQSIHGRRTQYPHPTNRNYPRRYSEHKINSDEAQGKGGWGVGKRSV